MIPDHLSHLSPSNTASLTKSSGQGSLRWLRFNKRLVNDWTRATENRTDSGEIGFIRLGDEGKFDTIIGGMEVHKNNIFDLNIVDLVAHGSKLCLCINNLLDINFDGFRWI